LNFFFETFCNDGKRGMLRKEGDKLARGSKVSNSIMERVDMSEAGRDNAG
jgi:hypothetical protein